MSAGGAPSIAVTNAHRTGVFHENNYMGSSERVDVACHYLTTHLSRS